MGLIKYGKKYRYGLDKSSKKFQCPSCGKRRFVRLVDHETNQYMPDQYGRCDRENNCGYFLWHNSEDPSYSYVEQVAPDVFPMSEIKPTLYGEHNLKKFLKSVIDPFRVDMSCTRMLCGSHNERWDGATVFWQRSVTGVARTGKVMLYSDGRRVKTPYPHIMFAHKKGFNVSQCLYGEHQLSSYNGRYVNIVESEKTAVIMTALYPQKMWLATGGNHNLRKDVFLNIRNFAFILYPDGGNEDQWAEKADKIGIKYIIHESVKHLNNGDDVADSLIKH